MEAVVLHRVGFLAYFCPKQGQDFKPSAAPLYPNMGQVPPPPPPGFKHKSPNNSTIFNRWIDASVLAVITSRKLQHALRSYHMKHFRKPITNWI